MTAPATSSAAQQSFALFTGPPIDLQKPLDKSPLRGSGVLVTGGSSGLGQAFSRGLAAAGAHVVIADLDEPAGRALEAELESKQLSAKFIRVDVTEWEQQVALFREALAWLTSKGAELDHIVTSAGVAGSRFDFAAADPASLEQAQAPSIAAMDVALFGSLYTTQLAVKYGFGLHDQGRPRRDKSVVLIGSTAGYGALLLSPDYTGSKYGVRGVFWALRGEMPKHGVRINLLAPFFVDTPLIAADVPVLLSKGVKLAKVEDAVEGVMRFTTDADANGRAVNVNSEGLTDLGDDPAGANSTIAFAGLRERKAFGS